MREIKFKAWDFNAKQMQQVTALHFELYRLREIETLEYKGVYIRNFANPQEIVAMQYTGLTDKNGVEIYEGDVVRFTFADDEIYNYISEVKPKGVVDTPKYHENDMTLLEWLDGYDAVEVIGNIYENPELLGGE